MTWGQPEKFNQSPLEAGLFLMLLINTLNEKDCNYTLIIYGLSGNAPECDLVPWLYTKKLPLLLWSNDLMWLRFIDWAKTKVWLPGCQLGDGGTEPSIVQSNLSCILHWWYQKWAWGAEMSIWESLSFFQFLTAEGEQCLTHPDTAPEQLRETGYHQTYNETSTSHRCPSLPQKSQLRKPTRLLFRGAEKKEWRR